MLAHLQFPLLQQLEHHSAKSPPSQPLAVGTNPPAPAPTPGSADPNPRSGSEAPRGRAQRIRPPRLRRYAHRCGYFGRRQGGFRAWPLPFGPPPRLGCEVCQLHALVPLCVPLGHPGPPQLALDLVALAAGDGFLSTTTTAAMQNLGSLNCLRFFSAFFRAPSPQVQVARRRAGDVEAPNSGLRPSRHWGPRRRAGT